MFRLVKTSTSEMPHRVVRLADTKRHGFISQKAAIFIVTVVKPQILSSCLIADSAKVPIKKKCHDVHVCV